MDGGQWPAVVNERHLLAVVPLRTHSWAICMYVHRCISGQLHGEAERMSSPFQNAEKETCGAFDLCYILSVNSDWIKGKRRQNRSNLKPQIVIKRVSPYMAVTKGMTRHGNESK